MIGQSLGHYRIEEKLGAGGMGVVYYFTRTYQSATVRFANLDANNFFANKNGLRSTAPACTLRT